MNLKVTDNRPVKKLVQGDEILTVKPGTLLRFEVYASDDFPCADTPGKFLMRTNSQEKPLVDLKDGTIWGPNLENYVFEVLENTILEININ